MGGRPALQSATKTAGKNNGGQALHKDGGQALDLLTIALKVDSGGPTNSVRQNR